MLHVEHDRKRTESQGLSKGVKVHWGRGDRTACGRFLAKTWTTSTDHVTCEKCRRVIRSIEKAQKENR